jgi:hypothetical protein
MQVRSGPYKVRIDYYLVVTLELSLVEAGLLSVVGSDHKV